ncbi:hypothetical protein P7K49_012445, partial [Saguinus oedipus]
LSWFGSREHLFNDDGSKKQRCYKSLLKMRGVIKRVLGKCYWKSKHSNCTLQTAILRLAILETFPRQ